MRIQFALLLLAVPAFARRGMPEVPTPPAQPQHHHKGYLPYSWGITQPSTPLPQGEADKKVKQVKLVKDDKKAPHYGFLGATHRPHLQEFEEAMQSLE